MEDVNVQKSAHNVHRFFQLWYSPAMIQTRFCVQSLVFSEESTQDESI